MGDSINPFAVLGVDETAGRAEIDAAYKRRARELHPDRLGDVSAAERAPAEAAMAELTFAHHLLTDERARAQYQRSQQKRRAAAAQRGEHLSTHPSRVAGRSDPAGPPPPPDPQTTEAADYRTAASAEFAVRDRNGGDPWVAAPRRRGPFRWSR